MTTQDDAMQRRVSDPDEDQWAGPTIAAGSWLSEQVRLIAIEEGFAE